MSSSSSSAPRATLTSAIEKKRRPRPSARRDDRLSIFLNDNSQDDDLVPTRAIPTRASNGKNKEKNRSKNKNEIPWNWTAGQISMLDKARAFKRAPKNFANTYSPLLGRSSHTLECGRTPIVGARTPPASDTDRIAENLLDLMIELKATPSASIFRGWLWLHQFVSGIGDAQIQTLMERWILSWNRVDPKTVLTKRLVRRWLIEFIDADSDDAEDADEDTVDLDDDPRTADLVEDGDDENDLTYIYTYTGGDSDRDDSEAELGRVEADQLNDLRTADLVEAHLDDVMICEAVSDEPEAPAEEDYVADMLDETTREPTFDEIESPAIRSPLVSPPFRLLPPPSPVAEPHLFAVPSAADETNKQFFVMGNRIDEMKKKYDALTAIVDGLKKSERIKNLEDEVNALKGLHEQYLITAAENASKYMSQVLKDARNDGALYTSVLEVTVQAMQEALSRQVARNKLVRRS